MKLTKDEDMTQVKLDNKDMPETTTTKRTFIGEMEQKNEIHDDG
jgi:hypothetical protein